MDSNLIPRGFHPKMQRSFSTRFFLSVFHFSYHVDAQQYCETSCFAACPVVQTPGDLMEHFCLFLRAPCSTVFKIEHLPSPPTPVFPRVLEVHL